jgi:protein-S-isoprenylcysteine O-methyltransferase Ste14
MEVNKDNAGIPIPPPFIYLAIYLAAWVGQKLFPIPKTLFHGTFMNVLGIFFTVAAVFMLLPSLWRFLRTRNTLATMLPASSLQTTGIYSISRNPMYVGMLFGYLGIGCIAGNWWHMILLPVLIGIIQEYVIGREERYLEREFGQEYVRYKKSVRRWL